MFEGCSLNSRWMPVNAQCICDICALDDRSIFISGWFTIYRFVLQKSGEMNDFSILDAALGFLSEASILEDERGEECPNVQKRCEPLHADLDPHRGPPQGFLTYPHRI